MADKKFTNLKEEVFLLDFWSKFCWAEMEIWFEGTLSLQSLGISEINPCGVALYYDITPHLQTQVITLTPVFDPTLWVYNPHL